MPHIYREISFTELMYKYICTYVNVFYNLLYFRSK